MEKIIIGQGTFGEVSSRNGKAVKRHFDTSDMLYEVYMNTVLHGLPRLVTFDTTEINEHESTMDLYDDSLSNYLRSDKYSLRHTNKGKQFYDTILMNILEGLIGIHSFGLVHCDVAPKNILYKCSDNSVVGALADFGSVRISGVIPAGLTTITVKSPDKTITPA